MRTLIHFLLTFLFLLPIVNAQEQHTFSSKEDMFSNWIKRDGQTAYSWGNDYHRIGALLQTYWYEIRNFDCWQWSYNEIPTEATVTSVTIKFRVNKGNYQDSFTFSLHNIPYTLNTPNINFYNESNTNQVYLSPTLTPDQNHNVFINQTFTAQTPVGQGWEVWNAVNTAVQSGSYFLTLGIRERVSLLLPYWVIAGYDLSVPSTQPCIDLIINFTTPNNYYIFKNKIQSTENYGTLILNNDLQNPIPSGGSPIFLPWGSTNAIRTNVLPFEVNWNNTNTTQKHNYWDIQSPNFEYSLHHNFQSISSSPSELKATFLPTSNAIIQNYSSELNSSSDIGNINLKDPWYYYKDQNNNWFHTDEFINYLSPLIIQNNSPTSYGGVFLNQDYNIPGNPYYKVKVEQVQNIQLTNTGNSLGRNHKFYFQNWSGTEIQFQYTNNKETGVVFKNNIQNVDPVVEANLKGTNLSEDSDAYNTTSQRKIVKIPDAGLYSDGSLHSVYSSNNRVWYEMSTDNGATWSLLNNGQPLDDGQGKPDHRR